MALRYGFYNSINHDRKYDALDMSSIFDGIIEDGVFATIGKLFAVTPGEGLQVIVDTGKAWFNHTWSSNDAPIPLSIDTPDITLARYDAVVLEVNNTESVRANSIKIIKGIAATDPQKPEMTNTDLVHQHPIAYILVENSATSIKGSNIQMAVGTGECPFVTGPLETVPIDALFARWESEFDLWFEDVQNSLDGDVAGQLLNKINHVDAKVDAHWDDTLSLATKQLYGMDETAIPDDIFANIFRRLTLITANSGEITITVKTKGGSPLRGIVISGISTPDGNPASTNDQGICTGIVSAGSNVTLSISQYGDIVDFSKKYNIVKGETYTDEWSVDVRNFLKLTATKKIRWSQNVSKLDLTAVGGGQRGESGNFPSSNFFSGKGGNGGFCVVKEDVSFTPGTLYNAVVGAEAGASSLLGVTANGATFDTGNGMGGNYVATSGAFRAGNNGSPGTVDGYSSYNETVKYGGGGGSGSAGSGYDEQSPARTPAKGGGDYAGDGGCVTEGEGSSIGIDAEDGRDGFGAGGGGASVWRYGSKKYRSRNGRGGSGCIAMRMTLKITT